MLLIGLTGGIGGGKSTVAERFAALGAGVVDTDLLARELTEPGAPALAEIVAAFGPGMLGPDGTLDRPRLRELVFGDPLARRRLEAILHPPIRDLMLDRAAALDTPYCLLVIPLLFETGQERLVDRVLVVDCPEGIQIERVVRRSGLTQDRVREILASQVPRDRRLAGADDVVNNSGPADALDPQVERLHATYLSLAMAKNGRSHTKARN